jgi:hypothetical protein
MALDIERLRRVISFAIIDHESALDLPFHWDQGTWGRLNGSLLDEDVEASTGQKEDEGLVDYIPIPITCATACCLAGNTVLTEGEKFILPVNTAYVTAAEAVRELREDDALEVSMCVSKEGVVSNISARARELLGITDQQAEYLFGGGNDIDDVCYFAEAIAIAHGFDGLGLNGAEKYVAASIQNRLRSAADFAAERF